jgi:predicted nucleic acid-binding protein
MIVVDTNVIGYLFLSSKRTDQAEQALLKDYHWAAPPLWRSEFCNVLATCTNRSLISLEDALIIISEAEQLMKDSEYEVASEKTISLATQSGCSAYDCEFVALAIDLNAPLVTVDKKILAKFPDVAISLDKFVSE